MVTHDTLTNINGGRPGTLDTHDVHWLGRKEAFAAEQLVKEVFQQSPHARGSVHSGETQGVVADLSTKNIM